MSYILEALKKVEQKGKHGACRSSFPTGRAGARDRKRPCGRISSAPRCSSTRARFSGGWARGRARRIPTCRCRWSVKRPTRGRFTAITGTRSAVLSRQDKAGKALSRNRRERGASRQPLLPGRALPSCRGIGSAAAANGKKAGPSGKGAQPERASRSGQEQLPRSRSPSRIQP